MTHAPGAQPKAHTFIGTVEVNAATAKMRLVEIAEEIISVLASDPQATVKVTVEINADFPCRRLRPDQARRFRKRHKSRVQEQDMGVEMPQVRASSNKHVIAWHKSAKPLPETCTRPENQ